MSHLEKAVSHLVALVLAHQAVVHEHTGELAAHRLGQQCGGHGESTPPDRASNTLPPPTFSRMALMELSLL